MRSKFRYLWKLQLCLRYPKTTCVVMAFLIGGTCCLIPQLGREFMPELEEGNLWLRGIGELNMNLEHQVGIAKQARAIMASYPEVESIITQSGRPDDGTDTEGYYSGEYFVPLRPQEDWPKVVQATGWRRWIWGPHARGRNEKLVDAMNADLERDIPGVVWNFSQNIRDNVMEALSGVKGDNSLKIFGPDIDQLELLADKAKNILQDIPGIANVGIFHVRGATHLQFRVDPDKCQKWGVTTADVNNVVTSAMAAQPQSSMVEGEKLFDIAVRWPKWRRNDETSILDIPVDIINNQVVLAQGSSFTPNASGHALPPPAVAGSLADTSNPISSTPRLRLRDLVTPVGKDFDAGPQRLVHSRRRLDHLPRERQAHDRHQVQRPRPRPGQRRGRGQGEDQGPLPGPLPSGLERRVRADGGSQRPAHVDHSPVAGPDLHPAVRRRSARSWTRS